MGVFILRKHAAYLRRPCCTKSVGPCAPELPADPICVPLLPPSPSTAALPVPPTEPQLLPVPRSPLRFPAEQRPSLPSALLPPVCALFPAVTAVPVPPPAPAVASPAPLVLPVPCALPDTAELQPVPCALPKLPICSLPMTATAAPALTLPVPTGPLPARAPRLLTPPVPPDPLPTPRSLPNAADQQPCAVPFALPLAQLTLPVPKPVTATAAAVPMPMPSALPPEVYGPLPAPARAPSLPTAAGLLPVFCALSKLAAEHRPPLSVGLSLTPLLALVTLPAHVLYLPPLPVLPDPKPMPRAQLLLNAASQLSAPALALGLRSRALCPAACLVGPVGPISIARVDAACHASHLASAPAVMDAYPLLGIRRTTPVVPPGASSLPQPPPTVSATMADPAPAISARITTPAGCSYHGPKSVRRIAVLKAPVGIRESRRHLCRIWRRVFQVF